MEIPHTIKLPMLIKNNIFYVSLLALLWCFTAFAEDADAETTIATGGNQIIVSPLNVLLDIGELSNAYVLAINKDGNPIEEHKIKIFPDDKSIVSVMGNRFSTSESGYVYFSILGKQQGDTAITITDGAIASQMNVSVKNLIHYVLPYFFGNMKLNLINPVEDAIFVKIQFHENTDRFIPPVVIRLESKEMKALNLSEELNITLKDGWAEIFSTEIVFGGIWTSKGYLPFERLDGQ